MIPTAQDNSAMSCDQNLHKLRIFLLVWIWAPSKRCVDVMTWCFLSSSGNEGNIFQIDEDTGNITMAKAADIVGPITLTILVKENLFFSCLLCGKIAFYLLIPHLVAIRRHRWPTGISLRWRRWSSRWWRRAGTLLASRRNDTKDSSTATPSPRAWSSETGAPTGPSGSEPGTRTLPLWVLFMNAGLNLNLDFYVTVLILKLTDSTRLSPFLHYCFVMLHICFIQLLVYSCRLFLQENNSCILHLRSLWT